MSLNTTPSADRIHIGIFGRRNAGKSSLINAMTGQNLSIVSDVKGTTTDPVLKSMELLPLGPVVLIDTPGDRCRHRNDSRRLCHSKTDPRKENSLCYRKEQMRPDRIGIFRSIPKSQFRFKRHGRDSFHRSQCHIRQKHL